MKLTRAGNTFTGLISPDGDQWEKVSERNVELPADTLVGMAVTSHAGRAATQAAIDDVGLTVAQ